MLFWIGGRLPIVNEGSLVAAGISGGGGVVNSIIEMEGTCHSGV